MKKSINFRILRINVITSYATTDENLPDRTLFLKDLSIIAIDIDKYCDHN